MVILEVLILWFIFSCALFYSYPVIRGEYVEFTKIELIFLSIFCAPLILSILVIYLIVKLILYMFNKY